MSGTLNSFADQAYHCVNVRAESIRVEHPTVDGVNPIQLAPWRCAFATHDKWHRSCNRICINNAPSAFRNEPAVLMIPMEITVLNADSFEVGLDTPADEMAGIVVNTLHATPVLWIEKMIRQFPHNPANLSEHLHIG